MKSKNLIIIVLATFCLTTLLMIPLERSIGEPDPWADVTGPGGVLDDLVNMRDVQYEILHFNENVSNMTRDVNVTNWPTQQLHNYTDAVAINVFDFGRVVNGTEQGIYAISEGDFFTFSPKQNFQYVSNFSYCFEAYKEGLGFRFYNYTLDINYNYVTSDHLEIMDYYPTTGGKWAGSAISYIKPGINVLHLQFAEYMFLLKMDVYIEYVYQA